jgi:choloylglycine hydrolase
VVEIPFSAELLLSPLHWLVADRSGALVVESTAAGLQVYDDPVGVLTNNPPFPYHLTNLTNYMPLHEGAPDNRLGCDLTPYSLGMGAIGLPGDFSSASRFVKAAFVKLNSVSNADEVSSVSQFFHILSSVAMPRGSVRIGDQNEITHYSCCCNTDQGIYYYTTYDNSTITGIAMHREDLDGSQTISYPLIKQTAIFMQN